MVRISFEDVGLCFGGKTVFRALYAELVSGRLIAVAGRNGSGKSTFLRLAARLAMPDSGRVTVMEDGHSLGKGAYRSRVAMATPEMNLYPRLTAEENLRFLSGLRGISLTAAEVESLWGRVGLLPSELRGTFAGQLSTGMRQRVKLAVLLALDADVWMLDEPCANLDARGARLAMDEARRAASKGKLVLWATNEAGEEAMADEIIRLSGN